MFAAAQSSFVGSTVSAQMRTFFDCVFHKPVLLREAEGIFVQLGNLLSILQEEATYLKKVRLKIATPDASIRTAIYNDT